MVPNSLNINPIWRMIEAMALLPELTRSTSGLTIHGCMDLYDDAMRLRDVNRDVNAHNEVYNMKNIRIERTRDHLLALVERMTSPKARGRPS
jgi:hypothetical protein